MTQQTSIQVYARTTSSGDLLSCFSVAHNQGHLQEDRKKGQWMQRCNQSPIIFYVHLTPLWTNLIIKKKCWRGYRGKNLL